MKKNILARARTGIATVCWLMAALRLQAGGDMSGSISSVAFTPGTDGFLYYTPGGSSHAEVKIDVQRTFSGPGGAVAQYRYTARLLDPAGIPINPVELPAFRVILSAEGLDSRPETLSLPMATRLDPYTQYQVEVSLQYVGGAAPSVEGPVRVTADRRRFLHFPNRTSGDEELNVISELISVRWTRNYLVDTAIDADRWLEAEVTYRLYRYDDFAVASTAAGVAVSFLVELPGGQAAFESDDPADALPPVSAMSYQAGPQPQPWSSPVLTARIKFRPATQLPSATTPAFRALVAVRHWENPMLFDGYRTGNTTNSDTAPVLHFNGRLDWGTAITTMTDIGNDPTVGMTRGAGVVSTTLKIDNLAIPGLAVAAFPDHPEVQVALDDSGNARVTAGSATVTMAAADRRLHGIRFELPNPVRLSSAGAWGDVTLRLPAGMGVGPPETALKSRLTVSGQYLNSAFEPRGTLTFTIPRSDRVVLDSRPLFFQADDVSWNTASGELQFYPWGIDYVRRQQFADLAAIPFLSPERATKPSNERYYQSVAWVTGPMTVRLDSGGRTALSGQFVLNPGTFISHFPWGVTNSWNSGQLTLVDDVPQPSASTLSPDGPIWVAYEEGCPNAGCGTSIAELGCDVLQIYFTPDSGLVAQGSTLTEAGSGATLHWGRNSAGGVYAHQAGPFENAAFAMAGHLWRGDGSSSDLNGMAPGLLLQSGAVLDEAGGAPTIRMVRPGSADYENGLGQYAGVNLAVAVEPDPAVLRGVARLGDAATEAGFALTPRSKYYARRSGVSGLHEAGAGGIDPSTLSIYGYPFEFQSFGLSFWSNENRESETRAQIKVPTPVDVRLYLEQLTFTCAGAPAGAVIADDRRALQFGYWLADVDAQTVQFAPRSPESAACNASLQRFLGLGVIAHASGVEEGLTGTLYVSTNGQIITAMDAERPANVTFDLGGPSTVSVAGALDLTTTPHQPVEFYQLVFSKAYFNDERSDVMGQGGWLNLFGQLKLPFYGNTPVHLMTLGVRNDLESVYFFNGGWTEDGLPASDATGDPGHRGKPAGIEWDDYRKNTDFAPYAQGEFLEVFNLGFPLKWHALAREFSGVETVETSLLLVHTSRELRKLSAKDIAIAFGAAYEGLPRIHLTAQSIITDDPVHPSAIADDLGDIISHALGEALTSDARNGFASLRTLGGEKLSAQLRQAVGTLVSDFAPTLRTALRSACPAGGECGPTLESVVTTAFLDLHLDETTLLIGEGATESNLRSQLVAQLDRAAASLDSLLNEHDGLFRPEADGSQLRLSRVLKEILMRGFSANPTVATVLSGIDFPQINSFLEPLGPEISRMAFTLSQLAVRVHQLRDRYASDSGDLYLELRALFRDPAVLAELNGLIDLARAEVITSARRPHWVEENVADAGDALEEQLSNRLGNALVFSEFGTRLDRILRTHLRSVEEDGVTAVDDVLALLQRMNNTVGRKALRAADEFAYSVLVPLDTWGRVLGFANVDGFVWISGDEVRRLRLNGSGGIHMGSEFNIETGVGFEINALDSEGEATCGHPTPVKATECILKFSRSSSEDRSVRDDMRDDPISYRDAHGHLTVMGGHPVASSGAGADGEPPVTIPKEAQVKDSGSFEAQLKANFAPGGSLVGFGGGFSWSEKKNYGAVSVARVSGAFMLGSVENYLAGAADATFGKGTIELQGGLFLGLTCSVEPLKLVNPNVVRLLGGGDRPFGGFYVYAEGWLPLVAGSCMVNLSVGAGAGVLVDFESGRYGGTLLGGVRGELLCVLSATGEIELAGLGGADGFVFDGAGRLKVKLGPCPFCVKFSKEVGATYRDRTDSWSFRY